ncbi:MAG TPA: phenylacetate--CoA ligase [Streptosporangiaceae bacterium]|jgi:phenylacetate-CoA ligase|nr:phenylacetate--CoA ligase [Streptosporangiaceae bacterium]
MYEPDAEAMPADERTALQLERLRSLTGRLLAAGGLTATRLAGSGVRDGRDVTALTDLPRLPMTTKDDLWGAYPFGMNVVPLSECVAVHGSSGTGGRPTLVSYTRADLALWARMCARALAAAGAAPGSIVHNAYGYGLFTGGLGFHQGAVELGATVVPASGGMTQRQVTLIRELRPDVLACTPSYAIRLGEALADAGLRPGDGLGLRAGLFGAEPWSGEFRARIESLLGLRALDVYGLSEVIGPGVACECLEAADGLHVNEDHFLAEAVDPATGAPVPDGTPGELVFSSLTRQALPLLRYRTGDIASLRREDCPCGRTLVKMSKITGRRDDMLVVRGVNVYPSEVERVVLAEPAVSPDYLLVMDVREEGRRLLACLELRPEAGAARTELAADLAARLRTELGVGVDVRIMPPDTVPRSEVGKAVRVVQWTGGDPPLPGLD